MEEMLKRWKQQYIYSEMWLTHSHRCCKGDCNRQKFNGIKKMQEFLTLVLYNTNCPFAKFISQVLLNIRIDNAVI